MWTFSSSCRISCPQNIMFRNSNSPQKKLNLCASNFMLSNYVKLSDFFFFFLSLQKHPVLAHFEETSMSYSKRATRQRTSAGDREREKGGKTHSSFTHTRSGDLIWQTEVLGQKIPIEKNADICYRDQRAVLMYQTRIYQSIRWKSQLTL